MTLLYRLKYIYSVLFVLFQVRRVEEAGAIAAIVVDNTPGSSSVSSSMFAMSGDGKNDVSIPAIFLFYQDASQLLKAIVENPGLEVTISDNGHVGTNQPLSLLVLLFLLFGLKPFLAWLASWPFLCLIPKLPCETWLYLLCQIWCALLKVSYSKIMDKRGFPNIRSWGKGTNSPKNNFWCVDLVRLSQAEH